MNEQNTKFFRQIPSVDRLLKELKEVYDCSPLFLTQEIRNYLQDIRESIEQGIKEEISYSILLENLKKKNPREFNSQGHSCYQCHWRYFTYRIGKSCSSWKYYRCFGQRAKWILYTGNR